MSENVRPTQVCIMCGDAGRAVETYRIRQGEDGGAAPLCWEHAAPVEAILNVLKEKGSPYEVVTFEESIVTFEQLQAMKKKGEV